MSSYPSNNLFNPYAAAYARPGYPYGYANTQSALNQAASGVRQAFKPQSPYSSQSGLSPNGLTADSAETENRPVSTPQKQAGFFQSLFSPQGLLYSAVLIAASFGIGRYLLDKTAQSNAKILTQQGEELTQKLTEHVNNAIANAKQELEALVSKPVKATQEIAIQTDEPVVSTKPEPISPIEPEKPPVSEQEVQAEPAKKPVTQNQATQTLADHKPVSPDWSSLYSDYDSRHGELISPIKYDLHPNKHKLPLPLQETAADLLNDSKCFYASMIGAPAKDLIGDISEMGQEGKSQLEIANSESGKKLREAHIPAMQHFIERSRQSLAKFRAYQKENVTELSWYNPSWLISGMRRKELQTLDRIDEKLTAYEQFIPRLQKAVELPPKETVSPALETQ